MGPPMGLLDPGASGGSPRPISLSISDFSASIGSTSSSCAMFSGKLSFCFNFSESGGVSSSMEPIGLVGLVGMGIGVGLHEVRMLLYFRRWSWFGKDKKNDYSKLLFK